MTDATYDNLTVNKTLTLKCPYPYDYVTLQCVYDGMSGTDPTLQISQYIKCLKSVSAYGGFLGTDSDWTNTSPWHGGGAILMGYGFQGSTDPPCITLTYSTQPTLHLYKVDGSGNRNGWGHLKLDTLNYKTLSQYGCAKELSGLPVERKFKTADEALSLLTHETTKEWLHTKYGKSVGTIVCTCGKEASEPCPEHKADWEDKYALKTSDMIEASAKATLDLVERVNGLETPIS